MPKIMAEYIWLDGTKPVRKVRSKTRVLEGPISSLSGLPEWGFDGSSTYQAEGSTSDCLLQPVFYTPDPIRKGDNILVLCEVLDIDGSPHPTNTRAKLREIEEKYRAEDYWFGIEQEYTFFENFRPLGWPDHGFPPPQGGYYCGVGADEVYGRQIAEDHLKACIEAGLSIYGINAEVMPAQWEFQIGTLRALEVADHLWMARWILYRVAEEYKVNATLFPKPVKGDWNGAGAHTNISTKSMREKGTGLDEINKAIEKLKAKHVDHIKVYGVGNERRLTGLHETAPIDEFRSGASDRGASIRIPPNTIRDKGGYMEDRRPAANIDPYEVVAILMDTISG